ncbi:MAG: hypothetical protein C0622_11160 [Desulfuromonas sp.]|nr:MAG: hypothetical protein C0622_11160 [Desulfuromonas sp.]
MITYNPTYHEIPLKEFNGNPMVEVLNPVPLTADDAFKRLCYRPDFDESERNLPAVWRKIAAGRLLHFYLPTDQSVEIFESIYSQIIDGYRHRSPRNPTHQRSIHGCDELAQRLGVTKGEQILRSGTISVITGLSGLGKSTLIKCIMQEIGKPCYYHTNYRGEPLSTVQILYLMRNVPDQCSPKAFCSRFTEQAAEFASDFCNISQTNKDYTRMTRNQHELNFYKIIKNNYVGALIIDEIQNLTINGGNDKKELVQMIHNFRDELGIPIILIGTYGSIEIFKKHFSLTQRTTEGGYHEIKRSSHADDEDWQNFCKILWHYQWIKDPQKLTTACIETLYKCSQGITRIALNIFILCQRLVIGTDRETIDEGLIKSVYNERFKPLHEVISILESGDEKKMKTYEELLSKAFDSVSESDPDVETTQNNYERFLRDQAEKHNIIDKVRAYQEREYNVNSEGEIHRKH